MEDNIADAVKMAGSVLLFVIGLSIAILSFSQARGAIDAVLKYSDRESLSIENDSRFYYLANKNDTSRYVGKETIIPAIYRAYKENYKIIFEFPDNYYLFSKTIGTETINVTKIDLEEQSIGSDEDSRWFLKGIIYRKFDNDATEDKIEYAEDYKQKFGIKVGEESECLYNKLSNLESTYKIKESLGTYYKQDVVSTSEAVADVNKIEKRVITYTFEQ